MVIILWLLMVDFSNKIFLNVYDEMVSGALRPELFGATRRILLDNLIFKANKVKIDSVEISSDLSSFSEMDFRFLGFKSCSDYIITTNESKCLGKKDVFVESVVKYKLKELIDLPRFSSLKCNCFIELLGDEFERIKIRSEWVLSNISHEKVIRSYANRHLQKSKKLYHDARLYLIETCEKKDQDNVYIVFSLNIFLIRTILFFQKFFRPFIFNSKTETEEMLVSELIHDVKLCKLGALFSCNGRRNCIYHQQQSKGIPEECNETDSSESLSDSQNSGKPDQIRFNGQINVLVDIFIQLFEELKIDGKPVIETNYKQLEDFLVRNFVDKAGKPLSRQTIITILKPYRVDKRLNPQSRRRVNIEKIIRRKDDNY